MARSSVRLLPLMLASAGIVSAAPLCAQQQPQQQPAEQSAPASGNPPPSGQEPAPTQPPAVVDPTEAAAEILRRRLGLKPQAIGTPPPGPPRVPIAPSTEPEPAAVQPTESQPTESQATESQQDPKPGQQPVAPLDPTEQAARALQKLLPNAATPPIAPVPDEHGTPASLPLEPAIGATKPTTTTSEVTNNNDTLHWAGVLATRYRLRHGGGASDHDLVTRLGVDFGRSDDPVSLHLRGRAFVNVDGQRQDDPFPGLDHSFGDDVNARLYAAHLDMTQVNGFALVRLGRQDLNETPVALSFDGVRADSQRFFGQTRSYVTGYIGVPVHQFESSSRGDLVAGVGAGLVPWQHARMRFDFMHLRDEFFAIDRQDTLLSMQWWQGLGEHVQLSGMHSFRDGDARDLKLSALGDLGERTDFRVSYRELLSTQRVQVTELDPFYLVANEYSPYRQLELSVTRELGPHLQAALGGDIRRLSNRSDERTFNREFEHIWADATLQDVLVTGLSATITGNLWNSSGEASRTITGELLYRPDQNLRVTLGAGYDLFRYDALQQRERIHVRSYYLRFDRRLGSATRLDFGYELQSDDFDEFHLFRLGWTWTF